ncbi:COG4 transport protein domain-containing protein [Ditylenchus destructor]|uniref:Conserved oligomeric Golgi complex subunit 4 n=1 Tax=Ditylenchus destructor TaxID=166010 RepID=A0AAD4R0M2_9BILA|nr:COG4 transport protein domain-containing protein [Ditylenchus destructor]
MHDDDAPEQVSGFIMNRPLQWKPKAVSNLDPEDEDLNAKVKSEVNEELNFDLDDLLADLRSDLKGLKCGEEQLLGEIHRELDGLEKATGGKDFVRSFDQAVARLNTEVHSFESDAKSLAGNLKNVSVLAENISSRVAVLDQARGRVVECLQRVGDLRDLRTCAEGVQVAMRSEEWDEAAQHIHRFFALDNAVFKMSEQQSDVKDSGQSMKSCYDVLRQSAADLKQIIEGKFDEALAANDVASMERFFKLFPLINEHSSGLKRFGNYLCAKIEKLGEDNFKILQAGGTDDKRKNVIYADSLTMIFEGIARIIELHQPLIDSFYGPDKLLTLIEIIQVECDKQTVRLINAFIQKRQLDYKAKLVDGYVRSGAAAEKMDALELDVLLSEITLMHTRSELYWRFLRRRLGEAPVEVFEDEFYDSPEQRRQDQERIKQQKEERAKKLDVLLHRTSLSLKMQEILGKYVLMEQYYMIESVKKAIEMDDVEEGSLTSTLLDDVFFIVRKSIRRSISSASVDCVCAMLNNGVTLLEMEFIKHVNAPIRAGYPSVGWTAEAYQTAQTAYNVIQHGKTVAEAGPEKQRSAFLVALNNLRASVECVNSLKAGLSEDFSRHLNQISATEKGKLENSVSQMDDLCKKLEHHANLGVGKLCEAAFRNKIKTSAEVYLDVSHNISEEELTEYEAADPFMENFIAQLDKQIAHFENLLITENYQVLLNAIASEAVHQFERVIFKCVFNRLGGLQLDKEYRQLTNYLTSIVGWSVREKCLRLSQIVGTLNSETIEEAIEFLQQQQIGGVLSLNEVKKVLLLRVDFPRDKAKSVKL